MMDVSMDTVSVQIETVVGQSNKAIDSLITKLGSLQTALKDVVKASSGLSEISKALNKANTNVKQPTKKTPNPSLKSQLSDLGVSLNSKELLSTMKSVNAETSKYKNKLGQVITVQKKMKNGMENYKVTVKETKNQMSDFEKFKKSIAGTLTKIGLLVGTVQRVKSSVMEYIEESASYVESVNLFFTEMGDKAEEAYEWVTKFSNALYLDPSDVMQYMGAFNSLINGLGVGADRSYLMSKNLTQLTYDLASYKNLSFETAYEKLMSGISGELEPLRNTGVALAQNTLQELANSLGIKKRISAMNEAEKAELRYIQIIKSSSNWQADLGKTLMSTENILKVAGQQWVLLKRALGDVATVVVRYMLPYMIALTQIITDSANALAKFLGFKIDFSKYKTGSNGVSKGIAQIGESADSTAKKLNTMLAPFDELNVVQNENKTASSSIGGAGGLGIDLPEYDALSKLTDDLSGKIKEAKNNLQQLGKVAKVVGAVFATIWSLNKVSKFATAIQNILGLFGFFGGKKATSASASGIKNVLPTWKTLFKGMGELAVLVGGAILFVTAIGKLTQVPGFNKAITDGLDGLQKLFIGLAQIALPLAGFSAGIAILGSTTNIATMATGLADLAIVIIGLEAVVLAVGALMGVSGFKFVLESGITSIENIFTRLSKMATPLAGFTVALGVLGLTGGAGAVAILTGLGLFAEVIVGLQVVVASIGALSQISGFNWLIDKGGEALVKIGSVLGDFAGSIASSAISKISSTLPKVGTDLALFAINATPFFNNVGKIDESTTKSMKNLVSVILLLTAQNIIDGLTSWFTGGTSLVKFGEDLADFAPHFASFAETVKNIDNKKVIGATNSAKAVGAMAKELPNEGGFFAAIVGDNNLKKFGEMLPSFGKNLKSYASHIAGINVSDVEASTNAGKAVSAMAQNLPNNGGILGLIMGENDLANFGKMLPSFGKNLKSYATNVSGINSDVVTASANAAKGISNLANGLGNQGGIVSWFTGDNKLSTFGKELKSFGEYFKKYYDQIKNVRFDAVNSVTDGIGTLLNYLKTIKKEGLGSTLKSFGESMKNSASDIKSYYSTALSSSNVGTLGYSFGQAIGKQIKKGITGALGTTLQVTDTSGKSISSFTVKAFANGGYPDKASLFFANENGIPELVGRIGNQTAVANNDQITTALTSALLTALSGADIGGQGTIVVNIGNKKVYEGMGEHMDSESERYGTAYVNL